MATQTVREVLEEALGPDWREEIVWLDGGATAAASIGQVHRARWKDGRDVAVKVQYPGAGEALMGDLRQLARVARGIAPCSRASTSGRWSTSCRTARPRSSTTASRREAQQAFADAFADDPDIFVPNVVHATETVLVTEWMDSTGSLAR